MTVEPSDDGTAEQADPTSPAPDLEVPVATPASAPDPDAPAPSPPAGPSRQTRPGLTTFTIEGRATPGLFVLGWLATILGLGVIGVGVLAPSALLLFVVGPGVLSIGLIAGAGSQALERRARGAVYAGPSPVLVFAAVIAVTIVAGVVLGFVLQLILRAGGIETPDYVVRLVAVGVQAFVFVGILRLVVVGTGALSWAEMGWRRFDGAALAAFVRGASWALPVIGLTLVAAAALVAIFRVVSPSPLPPTGVASGFVLQLIAGAVIAPVAEEALFRGFALTAWERTAGARAAIVRSALLFAAAHVITVEATDFSEAVGLIAVGAGTRIPVALVLGWLFVRTRSIWAPIGLHVAFNGILLVLSELAAGAAPVG